MLTLLQQKRLIATDAMQRLEEITQEKTKQRQVFIDLMIELTKDLDE